jgi:hypothetical protein
MAVVRHYECDECGCKFEKFHFEKPIQIPECPGCNAIATAQKQVPAGFSIGSDKSKAMDLTQDILEKDYGVSNFKDNMRAGDVAAITPPPVAKAVEGFFNSGARPTIPGLTMSNVLANAKAGAAQSRAEGRNPVTMLQKSMKAAGRNNASVICRPINKTG